MAGKRKSEREPLADDESRMARFSNLTREEKAGVRLQQQKALKEAEAQRTRPLGSRVLDAGTLLFGRDADKESVRRASAEDSALRESRYQDAKSRAELSDEAMAKESRLYGVDRKVKLKDNPMGLKKGGFVRTADGIAQRGKTKGRYI